ncbi:MAG: sodium-dependent bicarbonate transport family permease [Uliginosibacterium sp.]|nr:sodium-dependent bicarbonate transport family permease [Uliginosibacterium sp.]
MKALSRPTTILFFAFGLLAGMVRSDLEIPPRIARFLSLYLLSGAAWASRGGFALAESRAGVKCCPACSGAVALSPLRCRPSAFVLLRRFLSGFDAAAIAATYVTR